MAVILFHTKMIFLPASVFHQFISYSRLQYIRIQYAVLVRPYIRKKMARILYGYNNLTLFDYLIFSGFGDVIFFQL